MNIKNLAQNTQEILAPCHIIHLSVPTRKALDYLLANAVSMPNSCFNSFFTLN